jgi:cytochrome c-type biogenesis protein CcmE
MRGSNVRLVVSLIVASTLGAALLYTTVLGGTVNVVQVRQLLAHQAKSGEQVRLNGTVVSHEGDAASASGLRIQLADNAAYTNDPARARSITIVYHGAVPSAFRDGRAILVDGKVAGSTFDARDDSLSTKCPSKYSSTSVEPTQ